jgi:hypothetical protein
MHSNDLTEVAALCRSHLHEEERLLDVALPTARAIQNQLSQGQPGHFSELAERQQSLVQVIRDVQTRRRAVRDDLARLLNIPPSAVRLSQVFAKLPVDTRASLQMRLARVRRLAAEQTTTNRRLALRIGIYLDAYQRLLHDLTGAGAGSGRYGPRGQADVPNYRPLIQVQG